MPSIRDLFADPELLDESDDQEIDIDKILDSVTDVLNDRNPERVEPEETAETAAEDPPSVEEEEEEEPTGEVPPPAPVAPPSDPFLELPPERRAALLALDQAVMGDEGKRKAVFDIIAGRQAEIQPPKPSLPEHIDPESFEAQLWREQQEVRESLSQISTATREQQQAFAAQQANSQAMEAGNNFAKKYAGKLNEAEIIEIAKYAGQTGLAGSLRSTPEGQRNPVAAYEQAMEATLWGNEVFRSKLIDAPPAKPIGEQPEAVDRKRKLRAVSSAASPVSGPSPKRTPSETGADGRLTEKSRQDLVKELANGMARQSEGVY